MKTGGHSLDRDDGLAWLDLVREAVFITGSKQDVLAANAAGAQLLGLDHEALRNMNWRDLLGPEDQARWDALPALGERGARIQGRWELRHQDGRRLVVELDAAGLDGRKMTIVARPVSDERRAAEARATGGALFRFMVDRVPQFIWTAGADGAVQFCNGFWRTYTGLPDEEWLDRRWMAVIHPDDLPALEAGVEAAGKTGESLETRLRVRRADGVYRWFGVRWEPVREAPEPTVAWLGVGMDIEEQVRLEDALRKSEELFHELARLSPVGIFRTDPVGHCIYVNERWREMTGLSWEGARGDGWIHALHPDMREQVLVRWHSSVLAGVPYQSEFHVPRPGGETIWVLCQAVAERSPQGEILGYIGTLTDITERKRIEEQQLLLERRLQESQKLESLAVLAGGVAHDFNNLLTGILGNASLARSELPSTDGIQHYLQQIEQASLRAADLCKQMLAYSGKGRFVVERLDVNTLVEEPSGSSNHLCQCGRPSNLTWPRNCRPSRRTPARFARRS